MKYLSDMHTHTIASGHGSTATISDMAKAAADRGLRLLGITDHGPATLNSAAPSYFCSLSLSPRHRCGIDVLYGIELNILDTEGHVDLKDELIDWLDYAIISMHSHNFLPHSREENTQAFLNALQHPNVRILGHADSTHYPIDVDAVAREAKNRHAIFEINEASLVPGSYRGDTRENCRRILECSIKYDLPVVLSSDSHGTARVGDFTYASRFLEEAHFPEELILNNRLEQLKSFLTGGV